MKKLIGIISLLTAVFLLAGLFYAKAGDDKAEELIRKMDHLLHGVDSGYGVYTMTIQKKRWKNPRVIKMKAWEMRATGNEPGKSFILITDPVSESGKAFLKIGNEMWSYFPDVNTTTKIPPSMMMQDWMGSDFTNDDLVRESSIIKDYTHKIVDTRQENGQTLVTIESIPKPDAPVSWGKILTTVREADAIPIKEEFYNEKGELVRTMLFEDIKEMGGKTLPATWKMRPDKKPGDMTTFVIDHIEFNVKVDAKIFTLANLRKGGR